MKRFVLTLTLLCASLFSFLTFHFSLDSALAQEYKLAGPYEVVARDGEFRSSKAGSERDMKAAWGFAKEGKHDEARLRKLFDCDVLCTNGLGFDDDLLEITAYVQLQKGVRIEIACEVRRKGEEAILAKGFTRHCFVSTKDFRPVPPPPRLVAALEIERCESVSDMG